MVRFRTWAALVGLVGSMLATVATTAEELWIPVVAHQDGAQDSSWRSDVVVLSTCDHDLTVTLRLHTEEVVEMTLSLAARSQLVVADIVAELLVGDASGALEVRADGPIVVTSRTFTDGPGGSFGQSLDGIPMIDGFSVGEVVLLPGLAEHDRLRSNIGVVNMGPDAALFEVALFDSDGSWIGAWEQSLEPRSMLQDHRPFASRFGRSDIDDGWAEITVLQGSSVGVYGSMVDNLSNDPATIVARQGRSCEVGCPPVSDTEPSQLYDHRIGMAVSADGVDFVDAGLVLEHASVPDAVLRDDGEVWLYAVNANPGQHGIWVARQADDGSWSFTDCVRIDGSFEGDAVDPDVRRTADGRYRLSYYLGHFVTAPEPDASALMYTAVSDDGINFTVEALSYEHPSFATDPTVIQVNEDRWLMVIAISGGSPDEAHTLLLASDDGLHFEPTGTVLPGGIPELALLPDGRVRLFHSGGGAIRSQISADDGETWQEEAGDRMPGIPGNVVADPSVIMLPDGSWQMFYKSFLVQPPPS